MKVYRGKHKLGYLPRSDNRIIARVMDQGMQLKGMVRSVDLEGQAYRRMKVGVYVGGV